MLRSQPIAVQRTCSSRAACLGVALPRPHAAGLRRGGMATRALDPSHAADVAASATSVLGHLHSNVLATLADAASETATAAAAAATPASAQSGPFDFLADAFEALLRLIDDGLENAHVPYSYGFAIITLTVLVKLATFPLSQKQVSASLLSLLRSLTQRAIVPQVESSVAIQALQPRVKELQAKYVGEPETLQLETARLYKEAGVNPLAGCLPTLATIPVFIGLYKALSRAADEGLGQESFFWIPDLSGPTTLTERASGAGSAWLFPFVDGHPPIGWSNALAYLIMPALLVASQYASMKIVSPPQNKDDPAAQQSQAILKFLPLMIGWFSLNVPSGLTLYWFVNNILSTGQQLYLKSTTTVKIPEAPKTVEPVGTIVKPKEERVKKVTGKDLGARRRKDDDDGVVDVESVEVSSSSGQGMAQHQASGQGQQGQPQLGAAAQQQQDGGSRGKGGRKGEKFRAIKAREAAGKAAAAVETVEPRKEVVEAKKD